MFLSRCSIWCYGWLSLFALVQGGPVPDEPILDTSCTTPDGLAGACVPVRLCKHVRYLIRRKQHNYQDTVLLESLKCGGTSGVPSQQSLICCPRLSNDPNCGSSGFASRIYGGTESEIGQYPWLALLRFQERNGKLSVSCAGSLIGPRFVLSAVHCFRSRAGKPKQLKYVRLGEWNFQNHRGRSNCRKLDDGGGREVCRKDYGVVRVALYPEYAVNAAAHTHDIALIELAEKVEYSEYVSPICLPLQESSESLSRLPVEYTAAGWGATLETDGMTPVLQAVDLLPFDKERCRKVYPVPNAAGGIGDGHICAGGVRGQDTCDGDSGGPLMQRADGVAYLVGITSFGWPECGREGKPGVYTNVTHYLDWVAYEVLLGSRLGVSEVDDSEALWVV